jgi:DtxR family Mn-dependent transcriptional regulator
MRQNIAEEYLETILYLTKGGLKAKTKDIADEMGIKPPSVSEMLLKLKGEGLVDYQPYLGVSLTPSGREKAEAIARKHQLLEKFLVDTLGVDTNTAHNEACAMEHSVSEQTTAKLCEFLGHPRLCPDDHPIIEGECCKAAPASVPLTSIREGEDAIIRIVGVDRDAKDNLISLGFMPDVILKVKKKLPSGSLLVRIKGSEIAIGKDFASRIFVTRT